MNGEGTDIGDPVQTLHSEQRGPQFCESLLLPIGAVTASGMAGRVCSPGAGAGFTT